MTKEEKAAADKAEREKLEKEKSAAAALAQSQESTVAELRKMTKDAIDALKGQKKGGEPSQKNEPENLTCPKCGTIWDVVKEAWTETAVKAESWLAGFFSR